MKSVFVCVLLRITEFLDFVHCPVLYKLENTTFKIVDLFLSLGGGSVFCFLEYWTMDKVQKPSNSEYYTPSTEIFRFNCLILFVMKKDIALELNILLNSVIYDKFSLKKDLLYQKG
jgi:hypothetical protein